MEVILLILAGLFLIIGIVGSILPAIPGPPMCYLAILLTHFSDAVQFSTFFLITSLTCVVVVTILDNVIPMWTTRIFGGSKYAMWGSVVGLLVGFIFSPIGIILGTLVGAILGELYYKKNFIDSLKSGLGAFVGFILTVGLKLACCGVFVYYYVIEIYKVITN